MQPTMFAMNDLTIHDHAVNILLGPDKQQCELRQGQYSFLVGAGSLYYRKGNRDWALIANWVLYRTWLIVRYRQSAWLKPMYGRFFERIGYKVLAFKRYTVEVRDRRGTHMSGRRFNFSPPQALETMLKEKFGFTPDVIARVMPSERTR